MGRGRNAKAFGSGHTLVSIARVGPVRMHEARPFPNYCETSAFIRGNITMWPVIACAAKVIAVEVC
jgi:hypothetical protein